MLKNPKIQLIGMTSIESGRVCMKSVGRESGNYCVVLKSVDKSFALVTGPKILTGVKKRNANVMHLQPTEFKISVTESSTDEQIVEEMKKAGLVKKLNLKLPSAAQLKAKEAKRAKKDAAAKATPKPEKKETKAKK